MRLRAHLSGLSLCALVALTDVARAEPTTKAIDAQARVGGKPDAKEPGAREVVDGSDTGDASTLPSAPSPTQRSTGGVAPAQPDSQPYEPDRVGLPMPDYRFPAVQPDIADSSEAFFAAAQREPLTAVADRVPPLDPAAATLSAAGATATAAEAAPIAVSRSRPVASVGRSLPRRRQLTLAQRATVMLAATVDEPHHGALAPVRGSDGVLESWEIRAASAQAFFNVCPDDVRAHEYRYPAVGFCSGVAVAADLVLTAGHCVDAVRDIGRIRVVTGFDAQALARNAGRIPARDVTAVRLEARGEDAEADWALLRLVDRAVTFAAQTCRIGEACEGADGVVAIGHPLGMPRHFGKISRVVERTPGRMLTDLDTFVGSSGSPVFDVGRGKVLGIVVSGTPDFRRSRSACVRTTRTHHADGLRRREAVLPLAQLPPEVRLRMVAIDRRSR